MLILSLVYRFTFMPNFIRSYKYELDNFFNNLSKKLNIILKKIMKNSQLPLIMLKKRGFLIFESQLITLLKMTAIHLSSMNLIVVTLNLVYK